MGTRNSSQIDELFIRGRHEKFYFYYSSQNYFGLPFQSIRINSYRPLQFKQTLRDVRNMYTEIGGYVMKYDEYEEMFRKARSEKLNYLCIDMSKNENEGKYRSFNESKNAYIECSFESEAF